MPIQNLKRVFPVPVRDVIDVKEWFMVYLQSGVLVILDNQMEMIRSMRVSERSFSERPAPPL